MIFLRSGLFIKVSQESRRRDGRCFGTGAKNITAFGAEIVEGLNCSVLPQGRLIERLAATCTLEAAETNE